jgi:hypothetical protein
MSAFSVLSGLWNGIAVFGEAKSYGKSAPNGSSRMNDCFDLGDSLQNLQ